MYKWLISFVIAVILLTGCLPSTVKVSNETSEVTFTLVNKADLSSQEMADYKKEVEEAFHTITNLLHTDYTPAKEIEITFYAESGPSYGDVDKITLYQDHGSYHIYHELTHSLLGHGKVIDGEFGGSSGFFTQEGFAMYVEDQYTDMKVIPGYDISFHQMVRQCIALERNLPLKRLTDNYLSFEYFRSYTDSNEESLLQMLSYLHAGSFITYLIDQYGMKTFEKVYNTPNLQLAVKEVYGKDIIQLEEEWLQYIIQTENELSLEERRELPGYHHLEKTIMNISDRYF
ncbi:hypothetical protein ACFSCX_23520 [Bacillus salitolerans]|uniref:DUF1570 domain-containing protein n=1 Tax=Bacillus salitolerans TaxID=1437434 RepID=A0ABW4LWC4_9BACI